MEDTSSSPASTPPGSPSVGRSMTTTERVADKEGYLTLRKGKYKGKKNRKLNLNKKWEEVYVQIVGGSLHYYINLRDGSPKESLDLKDSKLSTDTHEEFKALKYVFTLSNDKGEYIFKTEEEDIRDEWLTAMKDGSTKAPQKPIIKPKAKIGLKNRVERNVIGHAATSPLGKRAIRSKAPKEVAELIAAMKVIVEKESGSTKKANEIEDTIFKLGIKIFYLVQKGELQIGDVLVADTPVRKALDLFIRCRNHVLDRSETRGRRQTFSINTEQLKEKLEEVCKLVIEAADLLKKVLAPHLTAKSLKRIDVLVAYAGDPYVLYKIVMDRSMQDELYELVSAGEHYSQFHFYADD